MSNCFGGSEDNNAFFFYDGACRSSAAIDAATSRWLGQMAWPGRSTLAGYLAQARMETCCREYSDGPVIHCVLSP